MKLEMNTGERLSMELFDKIMKEGSQNGLKAVNFGFSGECLLTPENLISMIYKARKAGVIDIRVITNGTLMTERLARELLKSPLTFLSLSVDAGKPETYAKVKGRNCFNSLLDSAKYIYTEKKKMKADFPLIRASFYPSPESEGEEELFLSRFQDYVDFVDFQQFQQIGRKNAKEVKIECRAPFQRMAVFANGDVSPCCTFFSKKLIVGNANNATLKEIWNSDDVKKVRDALVAKKPLAICAECLKKIS
jgi:radical SAM protein with 4Fe4S-binding SPASM domain